jgi:hypothetical protein
MLELVREAVLALQSETAAYPQAVQLWMKVMGLSFLASIVFVRWRVGARWILLALVLNILGLITGKIAFPEASRTVIGTYVHLLFWPAILWAVWRTLKFSTLVRRESHVSDWAYLAWLVWASLLMAISLVFDVRTLVTLWI